MHPWTLRIPRGPHISNHASMHRYIRIYFHYPHTYIYYYICIYIYSIIYTYSVCGIRLSLSFPAATLPGIFFLRDILLLTTSLRAPRVTCWAICATSVPWLDKKRWRLGIREGDLKGLKWWVWMTHRGWSKPGQRWTIWNTRRCNYHQFVLN